MNVNPRISFPPEVDFFLISTLIREMCRVAFAMQTLDPPLDFSFASDGELYNDRKSVLCALLCLNYSLSFNGMLYKCSRNMWCYMTCKTQYVP